MDMNRLDSKTRAAVISALVEGCSIRSTVRMTGVSAPTVLKLLVDAGTVAARFQDHMFSHLNSRRIQVDEMWAFIGAKQKNVTPEVAARNPDAGDIWLWTAIDADTKIVPCWMLGGRDAGIANEFLEDLRQRISGRVQITSDGYKPYIEAVENAFGSNVDYAMLVKMYGESSNSEKRYSPAECIGCKRSVIVGNPDAKHISTSYAERQNLNVRMGIRRYTRLTNAFSRKLLNHAAAVALYFFSYNFVKIHRTLRTTPAMAAGVVSRPFEVCDLVEMLEQQEAELRTAA